MIVPLDLSRLAECVLPHVVAVARTFKTRATLLHVLEQTSLPAENPVDPVDWSLRRAEAVSYLEKTAGRLWEADVEADHVVLEGQPAERVIDFARRESVDLILISTHGRSGVSGWDISSVVQKIILRSHTSTMLIRAYRAVAGELSGVNYQRILVPLDGSRRAEHVLPVATALARAHGAILTLAHVVPRPQMARRAPPTAEDIELERRITERNREEAGGYLELLRGQLTARTETSLLVNHNVPAKLHDITEQRGIDLTVLSAHGYSGRTRWRYGSIATSFIGYGFTPLLVIQDLAPDEIEPTKAQMASKERKGH